MKAIIVIDIDENHLLKETNELYERLKGYKCELKPLPEFKSMTKADSTYDPWEDTYRRGWNACLEEIEK